MTNYFEWIEYFSYLTLSFLLLMTMEDTGLSTLYITHYICIKGCVDITGKWRIMTSPYLVIQEVGETEVLV